MLLIILMEEIQIFMKYDANFMQLLRTTYIFPNHASQLPVKTNMICLPVASSIEPFLRGQQIKRVTRCGLRPGESSTARRGIRFTINKLHRESILLFPGVRRKCFFNVYQILLTFKIFSWEMGFLFLFLCVKIQKIN